MLFRNYSDLLEKTPEELKSLKQTTIDKLESTLSKSALESFRQSKQKDKYTILEKNTNLVKTIKIFINTTTIIEKLLESGALSHAINILAKDDTLSTAWHTGSFASKLAFHKSDLIELKKYQSTISVQLEKTVGDIATISGLSLQEKGSLQNIFDTFKMVFSLPGLNPYLLTEHKPKITAKNIPTKIIGLKEFITKTGMKIKKDPITQFYITQGLTPNSQAKIETTTLIETLNAAEILRIKYENMKKLSFLKQLQQLKKFNNLFSAEVRIIQKNLAESQLSKTENKELRNIYYLIKGDMANFLIPEYQRLKFIESTLGLSTLKARHEIAKLLQQSFDELEDYCITESVTSVSTYEFKIFQQSSPPPKSDSNALQVFKKKISELKNLCENIDNETKHANNFKQTNITETMHSIKNTSESILELFQNLEKLTSDVTEKKLIIFKLIDFFRKYKPQIKSIFQNVEDAIKNIEVFLDNINKIKTDNLVEMRAIKNTAKLYKKLNELNNKKTLIKLFFGNKELLQDLNQKLTEAKESCNEIKLTESKSSLHI